MEVHHQILKSVPFVEIGVDEGLEPWRHSYLETPVHTSFDTNEDDHWNIEPQCQERNLKHPSPLEQIVDSDDQ